MIFPHEIPGDDVYEFFGAYGDVLTVERSKSPTFPTLCDSNRVIKIVLKKTCRISCPFVVAIVECGTVINRLSALYVVSLVIVPSPAPSLACACAAVSRATGLGTVGRPGALFPLADAVASVQDSPVPGPAKVDPVPVPMTDAAVSISESCSCLSSHGSSDSCC